MQIALVGLWIAAQGAAVGGETSLLNLRGFWAITPVCVAGLAASVGTMVAQRRDTFSGRKLFADTLRLLAPPYVIAILTAILILGPIFTTDFWTSYLKSPQTWEYLVNLVGWPRYSLPGMFAFNALPETVNQNVWIAPCLVVVVAVGAYLPAPRVLRAVPLVVVLLLAGSALIAQALDLDLGDPSAPLALVLRGDGLSGLFAGSLGVLLYRARRRTPSNSTAAAVCATIVVAIAITGNENWRDLAAVRLLITVPVAYMALVLPQQRWTPSPLAARLVPYLPGLLLFSFPLQQAAVEIGPSQQAPLYAIAFGSGAALLLAAGLWETAGRRVISAEDRRALSEAVTAGRAEAADRSRRGTVVSARLVGAWLLVGLIFVALTLGLAYMLYVAFQPDRGGI